MKLFMPLLIVFLMYQPIAHGKEYVYVSYAVDDSYYSGKDTYTIDTDNNIAYADHGVQKIALCQKETKLYCFIAGSIVFAIPRKEVSIGESWSREGQNFTADRSEKIRFLGQERDVVVISTKRNETRHDYFYYSTKDGLVGIKIVDKGKKPYVRFLLLTNRKGFPK